MRLKMRMGAPAIRAAFRFYRDEQGVATIFACFMIMMMIVVGGIGVDLMHTEMDRTRLQNTLDRAVLAAADLDQPLDPQSVVNDYFDKAGMSNFLASVNVDQGLNFRTVEANAETIVPTQFMRMMGVDELSAPARSAAEERISNVEISLILDISGSMDWNNKMTNLRNAANAFAEALIRPEAEDVISISVVPYSEHVNVGQAIFDELNTYHRHNYSYCVEMPDSEFTNAALNTGIQYDQMQHFQWNSGPNFNLTDTVCPRYWYEEIQPLSQDVGDLQAQFNALQPRAGTQIFQAVKWGAALLDPSTRGIVSQLVTDGEIEAVFDGRPADYDDATTMKTMVVMTDGQNSYSYRIADWAYNSSSEYVHWSNYNFWTYLSSYVNSYYWHYYYDLKYTDTQGDVLLGQICDAAKEQGIIIWGVGFEVSEHGGDVLESCASSPSHYFGVEGVEISEAFSAIASQIDQLRLTQ